MFPYIFSIAIFILFVNSFFSVGEKVENIPGLSFRLYRAVKKINSLLLYKEYQKMRGQSIFRPTPCVRLHTKNRYFSYARACACVRAHLYSCLSVPKPCRRPVWLPANQGMPHSVHAPLPNYLYAAVSLTHQAVSCSLKQKKKAAPKRKPSLFFCCTRFVFFISAPKRGK